ncbi:MAG: reprolysin-like metallopeptidase, partial [Candidatus Competibacter denitrificans]
MPGVAGEAPASAADGDNAVDLFSPVVVSPNAKRRAASSEVGRDAVHLNRAITDLPLNAKARFSLPGGASYEIVYDGRQDHPSGNVTWSGYLKGYGNDYRAVITFGDSGASGRILTPDGEFLVESDSDGEWLIDTQAAGLKASEPGDDTVIPLPKELRDPSNKPTEDSTAPDREGNLISRAAKFAAADTLTTIDVMILYTPGLANRLGNGLSARLDQIIALSNQAYRDSGVYINLRLVHKEQVNYSDQTDNGSALDALTYGSDPTLAGVASLRDAKGADLVSLIRPFKRATAGGCGIAWIGGRSGQAGYGYSVVSDGQDVDGSGYYCLDLSFAHELGHNMGSMHDRAHAGGGSGAYPYSYGYGVSGVFGTVMSYLSPSIGKFSNPAITCAGGISCGVSEGAPDSANNALSLNNTRMAVADYRPEQSLPSSSYTLSVTKSGDGTVASTPAGIACGTDCSEAYEAKTVVTLNATPAAGYTFGGWSGACAGTGECVVTMAAAKSVTATFTAIPKYTLMVYRSGSGTVASTSAGIACGTDCSEAYEANTVVTLTATPAAGYRFGGWSGACVGTGECAVTMAAAKSVTATFIANPVLTVSRSGLGTVTSAPAGIACGTDCSEAYEANTVVTLTATPAAGYRFGGWSGACVGTGECTVTMAAAKSVTATFTAIPKYTLMVYRSGSGTVASTPAGIACGTDCSEVYEINTVVTLTATPAAGYRFGGWSGACVGTG